MGHARAPQLRGLKTAPAAVFRPNAAFRAPKCSQGHELLISICMVGSQICDRCRHRIKSTYTHRCKACDFDLCSRCYTSSGTSLPPVPTLPVEDVRNRLPDVAHVHDGAVSGCARGNSGPSAAIGFPSLDVGGEQAERLSACETLDAAKGDNGLLQEQAPSKSQGPSAAPALTVADLSATEQWRVQTAIQVAQYMASSRQSQWHRSTQRQVGEYPWTSRRESKGIMG